MVELREFHAGDAEAVNGLAVRAFAQYQDRYTDWPVFRSRLEGMSALAGQAELIVAELHGVLAGAVGYIGPHKPKAAIFRPEWPIMRMLVVDPAARGHGIGRLLAQECIARARRDGANEIALHTSQIMNVALPMYLRMGFQWRSDVPDIHGVPYALYTLALR
ncbi:GNAT family N-acetyltransferase [Massilia endophytica]|uniref:GNAT family N-acetyltransferase n=1 Tax=Massilia endophytica TaxID=2899220 RepID=UPI001E6477FB|nr:GNAT family N-acetyltransferase [Massilia endophytica]UGQ48783.1 GNAT family N-acetyltransferase [Massilia endophytica]